MSQLNDPVVSQDVKIFNIWTQYKILLHHSEKRVVYFYEREVWWAALGKNVGHEKDNKKDYLKFSVGNKDGAIVLSQARTISVRRLLEKIEIVNEALFALVKQNYIDFIA